MCLAATLAQENFLYMFSASSPSFFSFCVDLVVVPSSTKQILVRPALSPGFSWHPGKVGEQLWGSSLGFVLLTALIPWSCSTAHQPVLDLHPPTLQKKRVLFLRGKFPAACVSDPQNLCLPVNQTFF